MGKFKLTYPKKFILFSFLYFLSVSVFIFIRKITLVTPDPQLVIVTLILIYFNYIFLRISDKFQISFNIPVLFYVFLLYPVSFSLPYAFVVVFLVNFTKKVIQTRNFSDALVIAMYKSSVKITYVFCATMVFSSIYRKPFIHMGGVQTIALLSAFLTVFLLNIIIISFVDLVLMNNSFGKRDLIPIFYGSLSDFILFILFLPLYIMTVNKMNFMALFYIVAIYVLIRISYNILSIKIDIMIYAEMLKRLNYLNFDIDNYDSIEKSLLEYLTFVERSLYLENIYYYRETREGKLEITPDDKKIFGYLLPEIKEQAGKCNSVCLFKKGKIKHYPFSVMYIETDLGSKNSGMLFSMRLSDMSSYKSNYLKILFNRFNSIFDSYMDKLDSGNLLSNIISILVSTIEGNSEDAVTHSKRVAIIAGEMAYRLGYSNAKIRLIRSAGLLHDIGVVSYSRSIFAKKNNNELTEQEWNIIRNHPLVGYNVLKNIKSLGDAPLWILEHHERYDGSGFPYGKKGDEISEGGMILNLANVFDGFLFGKYWMNKVPVNMAIQYIIKGKGTLFDPVLVDRLAPYLEEIANELLRNLDK